jgi:Mor family transcriptional regulator
MFGSRKVGDTCARNSEMCAQRARGATYAAIGRKYGVSGNRVGQIIAREKWKAMRRARLQTKVKQSLTET